MKGHVWTCPACDSVLHLELKSVPSHLIPSQPVLSGCPLALLLGSAQLADSSPAAQCSTTRAHPGS
ncbi:hypothetical protein INR49_005183 [Caranx melampygus]|nr:hypothetical protein INR49_005183 [Caranx melampygus]